MVIRFLLVGIFLFNAGLAQGDDQRIIGKWHYYKKIYAGVEMPEPADSPLRLYMEFNERGEGKLYWWLDGQNSFCERRSIWQIRDGALYDRVTWINPKNTSDCSRDPDMQPGRETVSPVGFNSAGDFLLYMSLGEESLIYVWKKQEE